MPIYFGTVVKSIALFIERSHLRIKFGKQKLSYWDLL